MAWYGHTFLPAVAEVTVRRGHVHWPASADDLAKLLSAAGYREEARFARSMDAEGMASTRGFVVEMASEEHWWHQYMDERDRSDGA